MRFCSISLALGLALVAGPAASAEEPAAPADLAILNKIPGVGAGFDYASIDAAARRLYVARSDGVMAVDLDTLKVTDRLVPGEHVHAAVPLPNGRLLSTNGDSNTATLSDAATGTVIAQIPTGKKPDAAVFDPASGLVLVMDGDEGDVTLVDPNTGTSPGRIPIGGKLEYAAVDGHGHAFVNVEDKEQIAVLDTAARKVVGHYALPGCDSPTALGLDPTTGLLLATCSNRKAIAVRAATGDVVAHLDIDRIPDAVIFDAVRQRFYVPCGRDGTLFVIEERPGAAPVVTGKIQTAQGAHTGALDPKTGRLYVPTADFHLTFSGFQPEEGTFRILVLGQPG